MLLRSYERPGHPPVMLCVTFTGGSHRMTHPAEVCYEGQGWDISRNEEVDFLFSGTPPVKKKVNRLTLSREGRTLEVIVWYRTSAFETASYIRQKLAMVLKPFLGGNQWSAMIRLSAPEDPSQAHPPLESIAAVGGALLPWLDELEQRAGDS